MVLRREKNHLNIAFRSSHDKAERWFEPISTGVAPFLSTDRHAAGPRRDGPSPGRWSLSIRAGG